MRKAYTSCTLGLSVKMTSPLSKLKSRDWLKFIDLRTLSQLLANHYIHFPLMTSFSSNENVYL